MVYNLEEQKAFMFAVRYIADTDGKRNYQEAVFMAELMQQIGVKLDGETFWREVGALDVETVKEIVKNMGFEKKVKLEKALLDTIKIDGPENPTELKSFMVLSIAFDLPTSELIRNSPLFR